MERKTPANITNVCITSVQITAFMPPLETKVLFIFTEHPTYDASVECANHPTRNDRQPDYEEKLEPASSANTFLILSNPVT